jgi:hypothetical protein
VTDFRSKSLYGKLMEKVLKRADHERCVAAGRGRDAGKDRRLPLQGLSRVSRVQDELDAVTVR